MQSKRKKQFGIWMDNRHATVVGRKTPETEEFSLVGEVNNEGATTNSSEKNEHNEEKMLQHKFFKEILLLIPNAEEVHITGTGTAQEQLRHYMADVPQFKQTTTFDSTSNRMSHDNLALYMRTAFK